MYCIISPNPHFNSNVTVLPNTGQMDLQRSAAVQYLLLKLLDSGLQLEEMLKLVELVFLLQRHLMMELSDDIL